MNRGRQPTRSMSTSVVQLSISMSSSVDALAITDMGHIILAEYYLEDRLVKQGRVRDVKYAVIENLRDKRKMARHWHWYRCSLGLLEMGYRDACNVVSEAMLTNLGVKFTSHIQQLAWDSEAGIISRGITTWWFMIWKLLDWKILFSNPIVFWNYQRQGIQTYSRRNSCVLTELGGLPNKAKQYRPELTTRISR